MSATNSNSNASDTLTTPQPNVQRQIVPLESDEETMVLGSPGQEGYEPVPPPPRLPPIVTAQNEEVLPFMDVSVTEAAQIIQNRQLEQERQLVMRAMGRALEEATAVGEPEARTVFGETGRVQRDIIASEKKKRDRKRKRMSDLNETLDAIFTAPPPPPIQPKEYDFPGILQTEAFWSMVSDNWAKLDNASQYVVVSAFNVLMRQAPDRGVLAILLSEDMQKLSQGRYLLTGICLLYTSDAADE